MSYVGDTSNDDFVQELYDVQHIPIPFSLLFNDSLLPCCTQMAKSYSPPDKKNRWQPYIFINTDGSGTCHMWPYTGNSHCNISLLNTLRPGQNGCHFAVGVFTCIFMNENIWISLKISLKIFPRVSINNIPALAQIIAWHLPCNKPLSEPMVVSLLRHIWVS